jgi:hypothetical protein
MPFSKFSTIDHNNILKPNLHHKIINFSFSDIFNTPKITKTIPQKRLKFNFNETTSNNILKYNQSLNTDPDIKEANSILSSAIEKNIILPNSKLNLISSKLQESIITHATTHFKHTKPKNRLHKPSTSLTNKLYLTSKLANKCLQFPTLTKKITTKIDKIYNYWCKYSNNISDPCATKNSKCQLIIHNIENYLYQDKLNTIKEKLHHIDTKTGNNIKQMIQRVLNNQDKFYGPTFIQTSNELSSDPLTIKNTIHEYFTKLYSANHEPNPLLTEEWIEDFTPTVKNINTMLQLNDPITDSEISTTITNLKSNKSPGSDNISYEHIKYLQPNSTTFSLISNLLKYCFKNQIIPSNCNKTTLILLSKIPTFNGDPGKLRGISLLSTIRKIYTRILTTRFSTIIDKHQILKGHNYGFTKGRSTTNIITTIRHLIDHAKATNSPLILGLLDISKAYDTVTTEAIKLSLHRIGVPINFIDIIINMQETRAIEISTPTVTRIALNPQEDFLKETPFPVYYGIYSMIHYSVDLTNLLQVTLSPRHYQYLMSPLLTISHL